MKQRGVCKSDNFKVYSLMLQEAIKESPIHTPPSSQQHL